MKNVASVWEDYYIPPDPNLWQGRSDVAPHSCFFQRMGLVNLLAQEPSKTAPITFSFLGFKCDEGIQRDLGRPGAYDGPTAIRQHLASLPLHHPDIDCYDVGNIVCTNHDLEKSQEALAEVVALLLEKNCCPILLGGGHEIAWGHYQGIAKTLAQNQSLGLINIDAHFDLQPVSDHYPASATTSFYQIAQAHQESGRNFDYNCIGIQPSANTQETFKLAHELGSHYLLAEALHLGMQEQNLDFITRIINQNDHIFLSLSLDVFAPAFSPGVSSIQTLGLSPWQIIPLVRAVAASSKMLSYELAEYAPHYDIDHRTAKLAAAMIYEIVHHHACR